MLDPGSISAGTVTGRDLTHTTSPFTFIAHNITLISINNVFQIDFEDRGRPERRSVEA
jgi:hypothetical protein